MTENLILNRTSGENLQWAVKASCWIYPFNNSDSGLKKVNDYKRKKTSASKPFHNPNHVWSYYRSDLSCSYRIGYSGAIPSNSPNQGEYKNRYTHLNIYQSTPLYNLLHFSSIQQMCFFRNYFWKHILHYFILSKIC